MQWIGLPRPSLIHATGLAEAFRAPSRALRPHGMRSPCGQGPLQIDISKSRGHAAWSVSPQAFRSFPGQPKRRNIPPAEHRPKHRHQGTVNSRNEGATSSRNREATSLGICTLPRRMPNERMVFSRSRNLAFRLRRCVSRSLVRYQLSDLIWAWRNQPVRMIWAMLSASGLVGFVALRRVTSDMSNLHTSSIAPYDKTRRSGRFYRTLVHFTSPGRTSGCRFWFGWLEPPPEERPSVR
ncbi:hypothetical protein ACVILI_006497 [Mesorhizobium sp. USDA 4775]